MAHQSVGQKQQQRQLQHQRASILFWSIDTAKSSESNSEGGFGGAGGDASPSYTQQLHAYGSVGVVSSSTCCSNAIPRDPAWLDSIMKNISRFILSPSKLSASSPARSPARTHKQWRKIHEPKALGEIDRPKTINSGSQVGQKGRLLTRTGRKTVIVLPWNG